MAIFSQALKSPRAIAEAAATPPTTGRARLNITSIGERKMISYVGDDSDDTDHAALQMQQRAKKMMLRVYPRNTRFDSSNLQPLTFWRVGAQMVALNMQTKMVMVRPPLITMAQIVMMRMIRSTQLLKRSGTTELIKIVMVLMITIKMVMALRAIRTVMIPMPQ